nr:hypothetical protein [Tanacetum cinerariifolium]
MRYLSPWNFATPEFTAKYGISEDVHHELPGPEERIVDFSEDMDLFNLISAPNPSKVKTGLRPRAAHEVPLLTATASRVIDMEDPNAAIESSRTLSAIEKSPLDFDNENPSSPMTEEVSLEEEVAAMKPRLSKKRDRRTEYSQREIPTGDAPHPKQSMTQSFEIFTGNVATMEVQDTRSAKSAWSGKSTSSSSMVGSPRDFHQPGCGVTNSCRLDTPDACQDVVDHIVPPGYFSELRHMPNAEFLSQSNKNLAQQDQRIQVREEEFKKLDQEIQGIRKSPYLVFRPPGEPRSADSGEKRYAEIDAHLDALSIDLDEELYPHMLTAIAGHRWAIEHSLRLAVMKCAESIELREAFANVVSTGIAKGISEGLTHVIEHGKAGRGLELESLEDTPMEVIMASLHLESDSGEDAPKWIHDLCPSTSQLKIPVYPKVRDPKDPWAVKEEMLLEEAIAANVSLTEKKKRFRVVCRTHGIGSAHHARSDGVPVSVPTITPQGLAILLMDAAT